MTTAADVLRHRMGGVQMPSRAQTKGTPNSIAHISDVELFMVDFADGKGIAHTGLVFVVGGVPFFDLQSEGWMSRLEKLPEPLAKKFLNRVKVHREGVTEKDVKDIPLEPPRLEEK